METKNRISGALNAFKQKSGKRLNMLIGLDGFIDSIIHVVDTRQDFEHFTRINTIAEFGNRISKAAGLSTNIEFVPTQLKLGGNGPIFANALIDAGVSVTYVGSVGEGTPHPVFSSISERAKVFPVSAPGMTDALEFTDGKLMLGKHSTLREITWEHILKAVGGLDAFVKMAAEADLFGMENWTMIPHMSDIWQSIIDEVLPRLPGSETKPVAFFDLADPEKRMKSDIKHALSLIGRFEEKYCAVLGLNEKEIYEIAGVYGIPATPGDSEVLKNTSLAVYDRLGISCLVVHPTKYAVACHKGGVDYMDGPYCAAPVLTTGAGDNFNAGFCLGLTLGLEVKDALTLGVGTSGFYVRNARSPKQDELTAFLEKWADGNI